MSKSEELASGILLNSAGALSGFAASCLLETRPELAERFGSDAFAVWKRWFADRVGDLASSLVAGSEQLFVKQVVWSRSFLAAHGIESGDVSPAVECLESVLRENLPEEARDAVDRYLQPARAALERQAELPPRLTPDTADGRLAATYLLSLLEGNRQEAIQLLLDAASSGRSLVDLYLNVLTPALEEVGRMWTAGEISVAEEHFVTASARDTMVHLRRDCSARGANGHTALAAGVAGNQHDLGLQMIADIFELDGWRPINLGANVPVEDVVAAVETFDAQLLLLSAALTSQLPAVRQTIRAVRAGAKPAIKILVGGRAFDVDPAIAKDLGADGCAATAAEALALANALVT